MDAATLTFGIKDVIAILVVASSLIGAYFIIKRNDEKHSEGIESLKLGYTVLKEEVEEKFLHAKNAKKSNIETIMTAIDAVKKDVEKRESHIYNRMEELKKEQKEDHTKLSSKLDTMASQLQTVMASLAELNGYLRAKDEKKKL